MIVTEEGVIEAKRTKSDEKLGESGRLRILDDIYGCEIYTLDMQL